MIITISIVLYLFIIIVQHHKLQKFIYNYLFSFIPVNLLIFSCNEILL